MTKGEVLKKDIEQVYKLALSKSFRDEVGVIRLRAGIPTGGLLNEKTQFIPIESLLSLSMELLNRHKLSPVCYQAMRNFIQFNRFSSDQEPAAMTLEISYPDKLENTNIESAMKKLKQSYVGLYILDASSRENVIKIINKNWTHIKRSIEAQGGNTGRIRTSLNKDRNFLISLLNEKTKEKLCYDLGVKPAERRGEYKEQVIAELLRDKYGYKTVTFEMVRKYIATPKHPNSSTDKLKLKGSISHQRK
ncbi:MAG: hypothetical protein AAB447_03305 [Patescibacteria group bacterium]